MAYTQGHFWFGQGFGAAHTFKTRPGFAQSYTTDANPQYQAFRGSFFNQGFDGRPWSASWIPWRHFASHRSGPPRYRRQSTKSGVHRFVLHNLSSDDDADEDPTILASDEPSHHLHGQAAHPSPLDPNRHWARGFDGRSSDRSPFNADWGSCSGDPDDLCWDSAADASGPFSTAQEQAAHRHYPWQHPEIGEPFAHLPGHENKRSSPSAPSQEHPRLRTARGRSSAPRRSRSGLGQWSAINRLYSFLPRHRWRQRAHSADPMGMRSGTFRDRESPMPFPTAGEYMPLPTYAQDRPAPCPTCNSVPLQSRLNAVREAEHHIQLAQAKLFMKEVRIHEVRQRLDAATAKLHIESEVERAKVLAGWYRLQREKQQFRREREDAARWGTRDWNPHDHDPFRSFMAGDSEGADGYASPSSSWSRRSKSPPWEHDYESGFNPGRGRPPQPGFAQHHDPRASPRSPVEAETEARAMFDAYNAHWSQISRTDPAVAWPTCDLSAAALLDRCSIPSRTIHKPSTTTWQNPWTAELVMKANTQAFFLRAFGLRPTYDEDDHRSKVTMGFARANKEQTQRLLNCLKKEYLRWHSDRLRHRNGSAGGYNEALVTDARARAVLHGIVELKHVCEERLRDGGEEWTFV